MLDILIKYSQKHTVENGGKEEDYKIPKMTKIKKIPIVPTVPIPTPISVIPNNYVNKKLKIDFLDNVKEEKDLVKNSLEVFLEKLSNDTNQETVFKPNEIKSTIKMEDKEFFKILYDDKRISCPNCRMLFKEDLKFQKHLDLHFLLEKQKYLKKNKIGTNFVNKKKWLKSKLSDMEKKEDEVKKEEGNESDLIGQNLVEYESLENNVDYCEICQEKIKPVWIEDLGNWYYTNCEKLINEQGTFLVHLPCMIIIKKELGNKLYKETSKLINI